MGRGCVNRGSRQIRFIITGRMRAAFSQRIKAFLKISEALWGQVDYVLAHFPWKKEFVRVWIEFGRAGR